MSHKDSDLDSIDTQDSNEPTTSGRSDQSAPSDASSVAAMRSAEFLEKIDDIRNSPTELEVLLENAFASARKLSWSDKNIFKYGKDDDHKLSLAAILQAMLSTATSCGGEASARYTTSCILACHDSLDKLRDLATTWITHFLFICECDESKIDQSVN